MKTKYQKLIDQVQDLIKNSDDQHKGEELQVAHRFIEYYNKTYKTDYALSRNQPLIDDPIDVLANSKSNPSKVLKMQIKTFDSEARKFLDNPKKGRFLRIINQGEQHPVIKKWTEDIGRKSLNLDINVKKELILLLDGFWSIGGLGNEATERLRNIFLNEGFQEVWIVYAEKSCVKLSV